MACRSAVAVALWATAFLPGCISDDPRQGGILGGIHGLATGAYSQRIAQRHQSLTELQDRGAGLDRENANLQEEAERAAARHERLRSEVAALNAETGRLNATTREMRVETDAARQRRADVDRRLQKARADIENLQRQIDDDRVTAEAAEQRKQELEQELADLTIVSNALQ